MKLSFVIPAHNEENYLGNCLESVLREVKKQRSWDWEIVVVDNASTDGTREVAARYPEVKIVSEPAKGLVPARQRGLLSASGDLLAYLDADSRLSADWFQILENAYRNPKIVCLSGPYRYFDLSRGRRLLAETGWWLSAPFTYRLVGYMVLGGNFVARREALLRMGGFDTNIKFYGEDTNIAWRLHKLGKVVFRMDFFVWSSGRRLAKEGIMHSYWVYGVNFMWSVFFHKPYTDSYHDVR